MAYEECSTQSTNNIITASENHRKLTIKNPSAKVIRKIKVDGCLPITGKRCDYMFEIDDLESKQLYWVIYLELKGCDIEKAYNQLVATIDLFIVEHRGIKKECHIVASRVPKAGPKVQQLKIRLLKEKKATLIVSTDHASITI